MNPKGGKQVSQKEKKKWTFNPKIFMIFAIALCIFLIILSAVIGYKSGYDNASVLLKGKKITVANIDSEILSMEKQLESIKQEHSNKEEELEKVSQEYDEVTGLIKKKESIVDEISELEGALQEKKEEISSLKKKIADKQKELETLKNGIAAKKAEPRYLPAGVFKVGKDLPEGRYKIQPNGANGNFFVNDGMDANVILGVGADSMYLKEYVMELYDGDTIEATLPTKYTPVE
jgi:hypothetical protein